ncbi:MAG TPA: alpha/beta hydrolase [Aquabacterium sp.]|jgi:monoterpene epsilon-lactone hydrolase|nr:MAG: alpha/beta hydrolase [Burkholderiaceae bacterium]HOY34148.1 alpha/beta hydrolase [Piscinibacter sp.]HPM64615.1 alpha/beta hydrolase [Piscinibacter sp.]HQC98766.1 alpha/beta hydrolase [Aquabacterium sp.]
MPITRIRKRVVREVFAPAMRLFRDTLQESGDVGAIRDWAARLDRALFHDETGGLWQVVALQHCAASWFNAPAEQAASARRVILYLHGGAFVVETPRLHGAFVARLARAAQAAALMPHYRLAPENPFPASPDDAMAAYRWLLASGYAGREIVVAGDSAGGNLALGLLQRIVHEGLPVPSCAVALSPLTDATFSGESVRRNDGLDPMFTARGFETLSRFVAPDDAIRTWPLASPLFGDMAGLPPLLLQVGSSELLLDDSVRFAQRHPGAKLQVWHDMPHVFPLFDFLPESKAALGQIVQFIDATRARLADTPDKPTGDDHGTEVQRADREGVFPADRPEVAGSAQPGAGRDLGQGHDQEGG